jgi:hypothetical protein
MAAVARAEPNAFFMNPLRVDFFEVMAFNLLLFRKLKWKVF